MRAPRRATRARHSVDSVVGTGDATLECLFESKQIPIEGMRNERMPSFRTCFALFTVASVMCACSSKIETDQVQRELITLDVAPGEVVMAAKPAPVNIESPCGPPVIQGIGRYADVGFVSPRFFLVPARSGEPSYHFQSLPLGRSRFSVRFRVPRSESEAVLLYGTRDRARTEVLFCNVAGTLKRLEGTGINRLASWPVASVVAYMKFDGKRRDLMLDLTPQWASGGDVQASIDLSEYERKVLERDLQNPTGKDVFFDVSSRWRRTGCFQAIDLSGIDAIEDFGLRDGERGAVSLGLLRRAVSRLVSRDTHIKGDGDCGSQSVLLPPGAPGDETSVTCRRSGNSLECRFEGQFVEETTTYSTSTVIGQHGQIIMN
jgi:hypothetical protein